MARHDSKYVVGDFWLDKRRDGKSPDIWQIASYKPAPSRQIVYRSTHQRTLAGARAVIDAHHAASRAKQRQEPHEARVIPMLVLYWQERGSQNINHDQTDRSLRTFTAFLIQDQASADAVVTDLTPVLFDRFRRWRMGPHGFDLEWRDQDYAYRSDGVSGATVDRNINDVRAAVGHAEDNLRIAYAPRIKSVEAKYRSPPRERVLTPEEMAMIFWYARHHSPELFRFVALQMATSVRPMAAHQFDPSRQYDDRSGLIDLQPGEAPQTKKRNAVIPAIRPMRVLLRAWAKEPFAPVASRKRAWRTMRTALGLSADVYPKTIRHTIATWCYQAGVPERQVSEMLGHEGDLRSTTKRYAKYNPKMLREMTIMLSTIWRQTSQLANRFGAVHLLSIGGNGGKISVQRKDETTQICGFGGGRGRD